MAAVTRGTRLPAEERRAVILAAAGPVFARDGFAAARLDDVAAAAHVTKPILYRHFDSKKALYMALLERHERDLGSFFGGDDDGEPPTPRSILAGWLEYVRDNQHAWIMLFRDSTGDAEIVALRQRVSRTARAVLAEFIAEHSAIPEAEVDPTAELLVSGLAGMALWWIDHPDVPREVLLDVGTRMSVAALGG
jgi:AcrR family transcriptional regulator